MLPAALALVCLVLTASVYPVQAQDIQSQEAAGAALFRNKGCVHCHGDGATGTAKAPALTGLWKEKQWTPARITSQILNGGQKMPPFGEVLTDEEAAELVAYLRTRHKPAPPPPTFPQK